MKYIAKVALKWSLKSIENLPQFSSPRSSLGCTRREWSFWSGIEWKKSTFFGVRCNFFFLRWKVLLYVGIVQHRILRNAIIAARAGSRETPSKFHSGIIRVSWEGGSRELRNLGEKWENFLESFFFGVFERSRALSFFCGDLTVVVVGWRHTTRSWALAGATQVKWKARFSRLKTVLIFFFWCEWSLAEKKNQN